MEREKMLVYDMFFNAIDDLDYADAREEALEWFNERSDKPGGFIWCLDIIPISETQVWSVIKSKPMSTKGNKYYEGLP